MLSVLDRSTKRDSVRMTLTRKCATLNKIGSPRAVRTHVLLRNPFALQQGNPKVHHSFVRLDSYGTCNPS